MANTEADEGPVPAPVVVGGRPNVSSSSFAAGLPNSALPDPNAAGEGGAAQPSSFALGIAGSPVSLEAPAPPFPPGGLSARLVDPNLLPSVAGTAPVAAAVPSGPQTRAPSFAAPWLGGPGLSPIGKNLLLACLWILMPPL